MTEPARGRSVESATRQLNERVARLENENRRLSWAGALVALGAVAMVVAGAKPVEMRESIEAQEFQLRSAKGKLLANLEPDPVNGSPSLYFWDPKENYSRMGLSKMSLDIRGKIRIGRSSDNGRINLGLTLDGDALLRLQDDLGKYRTSLGVGKDNSPKLELRDRNEENRVELSVLTDRTPRLLFLDEGGKRRVGIDEGHHGRFGLGIHDKDGTLRLGMGADGDGVSSVNFFDGEHTLRGEVLLNQDGAMMLNGFDQNGLCRIWLEVKSDGAPHFSLHNPRGEPLFKVPQP